MSKLLRTVKTIGIYACGENVSQLLIESLFFVEAGTHNFS